MVHGIPPAKRRLKDGDIVGLDLGCIVDGFFGDAARTVAVGTVSDKAARLMETTKAALFAGIEACQPGKRVGDIGHAVQTHAESRGYSVVREFVGHGIGTSLHEEPQVPNYGPGGKGKRLVPGMCLAIEPMVNVGGPEVRVLDDGWTAVTVDGSSVRALRAVGGRHGGRALDPVGALPLRAGGRACLRRAREAVEVDGVVRGAAQRALPGGAARDREPGAWPRPTCPAASRPAAGPAGGRGGGGAHALRHDPRPHREAA